MTDDPTVLGTFTHVPDDSPSHRCVPPWSTLDGLPHIEWPYGTRWKCGGCLQEFTVELPPAGLPMWKAWVPVKSEKPKGWLRRAWDGDL